MIRDLKIGDFISVEKIHLGDFPLPNFNDERYFSRKVVEIGGKICAVATLKLTTEAVLVLDQRLPRVTRAKVLSQLISEMQRELRRFHLDDTHIFLLNPEPEQTEKVLNKHFGFVKAEGKPLYWRRDG